MDYEAYVPNSRSTYTVDVHYNNWRGFITVTATGTDKVLFTLKADGDTHFTIFDEADQQIASTKISSASHNIEVQCKSAKGDLSNPDIFKIKNDKIIMGSPCYTSPAFGNQKVTWKNKAMSSKIIYTLVDGNAMAVARFESDRKTKIGTLEFAIPTIEDEKVNEIVVTLLTLLHRKLQMIFTSNLYPVVT